MGPLKGTVAITWGGLVPTSIVARELNIRLIKTIRIAFYYHQDQDAAGVLKGAHAKVGNGSLIIDDLVNIGATARIVQEWFPKAHFATIYAKPAGRPMVDTFIAEVSDHT